MGNDRFLSGILIGCCLVLLLGIMFTLAEMSGYKHKGAAMAPAKAAPSAPEEAAESR